MFWNVGEKASKMIAKTDYIRNVPSLREKFNAINLRLEFVELPV